MKAFIQIALDAGHVYELPTEVIAQHRAQVMQKLHPDEFKTIDEALADTRELFDDDYSISDWARNNMNPSDYVQHLRLLRFNAPAKDYVNAEWSAHAAPAIVGELDGEQVMASPVEAVMAVMSEAGQLCNITVFNDTNGAPLGAAVMITGGPHAVSSFVTALQFTHDKLVEANQLAPQQTH